MALDLTTPTIRPPSALAATDDDEQERTFQTMSALSAPAGAETTLPAPQQPREYETPEGARAGGDLSDRLGSFAMEGLDAPSRYDSSMVQQGIDLVNRDLARAAEEGEAKLDEFHSARGVVGSSVEAKNMSDFLTNIQTERERRLFDLTRDMAATYAQDRASAAQVGMQAADFARTLGLDEENSARYEAEINRLFGRDTEADLQARAQLGIQTRAQELQALGMSMDEAFRRAQLEQQESEFARQFGLSGQELDLRAQQIQQQAELEGRSLDLQEARQIAEGERFDQNLQFQREQLAAQTGLDQQALDLQREQFVAEYADRNAERVFRMGLQESDQEFAAEQARQDRLLESRALDLQQQGLDAESAWREADRMLEEELQTRALDLEQQGLDAEEAYRQATLSLEAEIQNQQAALSAADIHLRALAAGAADELDEPLAPIDYPSVSGGTTGGTSGDGGSDAPFPEDYIYSTDGANTGGDLPQWYLDLLNGENALL